MDLIQLQHFHLFLIYKHYIANNLKFIYKAHECESITLQYFLNKFYYILEIPLFLDPMGTILVKDVPEDLLRRLKRLKAELNCRTWADLLAKLVELKESTLEEEELERMRSGVKSFLYLREAVSNKWSGSPSVLDEIRRGRRHDR